MELQNRILKIAGETTKALGVRSRLAIPGCRIQERSAEGRPGDSPFGVHGSAGRAIPAPEHEIGSVEFLMEHDRYKRRVKALDFADLEG